MGVVARPDRATVVIHGVKGTGATMGGVAIGAVAMAAPAGVGEGGVASCNRVQVPVVRMLGGWLGSMLNK
jgi:hypothetical protein